MKTFLLLLILISNSFLYINAQELIYPEIEKDLSAEQKEVIDEAVRILQKATGNENNANAIDWKYAKKRNKPDWEEKTWEAKEQRIIAERNYARAYKMISDVYSDVITNAGYLSQSDKFAALALNRDADAKFEKAAGVLNKYNDLSREVMEATSYESLLSDIKTSHDLKISGVRDQITALEIYERGVKKQLDNEDVAAWEKATKANTIEAYYEYLDNNQRGKFMAEANNKIRSLEKTSTNDVANTENKRTNSRYNSKNRNKNEVTDNYVSDNNVSYNTEENKNTNKKNTRNTNNRNTNNTDNQNTDNTNTDNAFVKGGLVFKVQIAASKGGVVSDWVLKHKAPGIDLIEEYRSKDWNKYMVGNFRTYNEAAKLRDKLKNFSPDAFVVVFEKNKQIAVTADMKN